MKNEPLPAPVAAKPKILNDALAVMVKARAKAGGVYAIDLNAFAAVALLGAAIILL